MYTIVTTIDSTTSTLINTVHCTVYIIITTVASTPLTLVTQVYIPPGKGPPSSQLIDLENAPEGLAS